ncbi:hypothetical protein DSS36_06030 [Salmonella enterica subsp. enterica serovar Newport]|nr:hypothetical protein [Salmonella enterica subsp. enterica serovar Newport]
MITPTGTGNGSLKIFIRSEISRGCRPVACRIGGKDPQNKNHFHLQHHAIAATLISPSYGLSPGNCFTSTAFVALNSPSDAPLSMHASTTPGKVFVRLLASIALARSHSSFCIVYSFL